MTILIRNLSILLLISITSLCTHASGKLINYDDFVHLSFQKQTETIQLIHAFLTENELQQQSLSKLKDSKKFSHYNSPSRKVNHYLKILHYFISTAHASSSESFDPVLFDKVPGNIKCYYAGWISFIKVKKKGKSFCVHPRKLMYPENKKYLQEVSGSQSLQNTDIYNFYHKLSKRYKKSLSKKSLNIEFSKNKLTMKSVNKKCSSEESISCNPDIYGKIEGSTLCVTSIQNYGVNSSYLCAKALEELERKKPEVFKSTMKEIIQGGIQQNSLFHTLKAMYDTCLCGGDSADATPSSFQGSINSKYASRIFESRTCAGILSQTQRINDAYQLHCKKTSNSSIHKEWELFLKETNRLLSKNIMALRNSTSPLESLEDKVIKQTQLEKIFTEDQKVFAPFAKKNYRIAKEGGLCPVLTTAPSLLANFNESDNTLTLKTSPPSIKITDLTDLEVIHTSLEDKPAASSESTGIGAYNIKRVSHLSQLHAQGNYNGVTIKSPTLDIPPVVSKKVKTTESIKVEKDNEPKESAFSGCKLKIEPKVEGENIKLLATLTNKDGKIFKLPNEDLLTLNWYDHATKAGEAPEKTTKTKRNLLSSDETDEKEEEDKKTEKEIQEEQEKYSGDDVSKIQNQIGRIPEAKNKIGIFAQQQGPVEQIYTVSVVSKDNQCRKTASFTIPKRVIKAHNDRPTQLQPSGGSGVRVRGQIYSGNK